MPKVVRFSRRAILPAVVFMVTVAIHFAYLAMFPEHDGVQDRWIAVDQPVQSPVLQRYIQSQSYWLGYSYGLSLAFTAVALRRYREHRFCAARTLAIGGVTLSGVLAVAGCFLLGCCGSPMLAVYLSLFGAAFLPFAKPLVAALTAVSLATGWWWMNHQERLIVAKALESADRPSCNCG
jgi:hypothetical protein